ncbi:hypothetical protein BYT27DRAFT_7183637 [Phlegmacium glaucopus]|nr:hypothetical protein BYT27DRAFT_7183637 [Phlegmacium glaucopus]
MVQLKGVINTMEVTRVFQEVGTEGQVLVLDVEGTWRELIAVVSKLATNLTSQDRVRSIAVVTTAVARGDLTLKIEISVEG